MNKGRIEGFSDGVFSIAITLLVFTIAQPANYHDLTGELLRRWPSLAAYLVSFAVIGIMWLNHHTLLTQLARLDRTAVYLNLLLLATVVFLPYPTGILGEALRQGAGATTAAVVYSTAMTLNACAWTALWLYASSGRRLLADSFPESRRRRATLLFTIGTLPYALSIAIGFFNAFACLAFHALLGLYYALDPLSRHAGDTAELSPDSHQP